MHLIKNPVKTCDKVYSLIQSLTSQIRHRMEDPKSSGKYFFLECKTESTVIFFGKHLK